MQHNSEAFRAFDDAYNVPNAIRVQSLEAPGFLADLATRLFRIASELIASETVVLAPPAEIEKSNIARLSRIIKVRRARDQYFPPDMFADAQWDILLDLTLAKLTQKQVMVSSVAIAAAVPTSTALRWIKVMLDNKLIERANDPIDRRRTYLQISDVAFMRMIAFLRATAPTAPNNQRDMAP